MCEGGVGLKAEMNVVRNSDGGVGVGNCKIKTKGQ